MSTQASVLNVSERLDKLYEFDREPIPTSKLYGGWHFAGLYAGECTAATEFVIGALFVMWGASVFDIIVGLAIGNFLAILSWTFVCAPIATRTRLTLYWYIHKIGGPVFAFIYNISNAFLFCILTGTMITVSASAVRIPFGIPPQLNWYPTDIWFVLIVFLVGGVITALAILGFKRLIQFASVCAPWMIVMFVAGALVSLPVLGKASGIGQITTVSQLWDMAATMVWTGKATNPENQISFWHVMAFAWICDLAMNIGLSDMALFRYAKKARYGLCTCTGMYLGHYVAWICAGIFGAGAALLIKTPLDQLDSGAIGYTTLGITGAIAVLLAGWTTANPVLYKQGLAVQAVTPNWPRWKVTAAVGAVTTVIACFPFVFTKMLDFVALYGLLLLPVGAIVFAEYWIFPKIGLARHWVSRQQKLMNWPALLTWVISIYLAMVLWYANVLHLFFLFIPVWFLSIALYIGLAAIGGARKSSSEALEPVEEESKLPEVGQDPPGDVVAARHPEETATKYKFSQRTTYDKVALILWGTVAILSLLVCLWMPAKVFLDGMENYQANLVSFQKWIFLPTMIYFVTGTYWLILKEKENEGTAGSMSSNCAT